MNIQVNDDEMIDDLQNGYYIIQKKSCFKFGLDAVLLSDFAKNFKSRRTMDLCTGTGIVPILLCSKTKTPDICALELQEGIADMAVRSMQYNNLEQRVHVTCGDLKDATKIYGKSSFQAVTCNPPYMKSGTALLNEKDNKIISRHEVMCTLDDVIKTSSELLIPKGHLFMVHRPSRLVDIMCTMRKYRIEPKYIRFVHSMPYKASNLILIEGVLTGGTELKMMSPLYIHNTDGTYTEEIRNIYERENI